MSLPQGQPDSLAGSSVMDSIEMAPVQTTSSQSSPLAIDLTSDSEDYQMSSSVLGKHTEPIIKSEDASVQDASSPGLMMSEPHSIESICPKPQSSHAEQQKPAPTSVWEADPDIPAEMQLVLFNAHRQNWDVNDGDRMPSEPDNQDETGVEIKREHVDDDTDENASQAFQQLKARYLAKQQAGQTSLEDAVEFARAENDEGCRLKRLQKDEQVYQHAEDDERLFCSDDDPTAQQPSTGDQGKHPANKLGRDRVAKSGARARGKKSKKKGPNMLDAGSLLNNDIVADAAANQGQPAQPGFHSTNKKDALAQLIASIPQQHRKPYAVEKKALDEACKKFHWKGQGSMKADKGHWHLKGMRDTSLRHFQLLGAAWMRDRENSKRCAGGIIADSMGFGKTVVVISTLVEDRPSSHDSIKTTLIVCPSSLCIQWLAEIKKHSEPGLLGEAMIYRGEQHLQTVDPEQTLMNCGVVITSFSTLIREYPKNIPPSHLETEEAKAEWWKEYYAENVGPLLRITWRRCVIDEAHLIKNVESTTSLACRALKSKYRWLLSGTPIQNEVVEFFPLLDFLHCKNIGDLEQFKRNYCKPNNETCTKRLRTLLDTLVIRRTGKSTLFGRPVVSLPHLDYDTISVPFTEFEAIVYELVRARFRDQIHRLRQEGKIRTFSRHIFAMFTCLRQMCSHTLLVWPKLEKMLDTEDVKRLWEVTADETAHIGGTGPPHLMEVLNKMWQMPEDTMSPSATSDLAWVRLAGEPPMSTKLQATKSLLEQWIKDAPGCKIIVFSQWRGMIKALEKVCKSMGWESCSYTGEMNQLQKARAIRVFKEDPDRNILLAGLKAGSLGLNLTMASRCIILEPWWNSSVEAQSFSRIYRIGQESDVIVRRIVVENTLEPNLLLLKQKYKDKEIDKAIGDMSTRKTLPIEEVIRLFGPTGTDDGAGLPSSNNEALDDEPFEFVDDDEAQIDSDFEIESETPPRP